MKKILTVFGGRSETVEVRTVSLVEADVRKITLQVDLPLTDQNYFKDIGNLSNPYRVGEASKCIIQFIRGYL